VSYHRSLMRLRRRPSEPSPPPGVAPADSIEGAAPTRGDSPQALRAGASVNVGKRVLGLTRALGRKPAVPVTPLFRKRMPGTPAPFSSVAHEKGRRLPKSAPAANPPWACGRARQQNLSRNWVSSGNAKHRRRKRKGRAGMIRIGGEFTGMSGEMPCSFGSCPNRLKRGLGFRDA
jgi:hypothetical protein